MLLRCLEKPEIEEVISELHEGACGGHKYWKATTYKILRYGYYWPYFFFDVYQQVRDCIQCQKFVGKQKLVSLPLKPIVVNSPFQQWGLEFIGEINIASSRKHRWILRATDFLTKWVEAIPTRNVHDKVIIKFIQENILSRFGCPKKLLTNNVKTFKSKAMVTFCEQNGIVLKHSTPYYPHGNGFSESTNKNIIQSIRKLLNQDKRSWDLMLKYALWVDRITTKKEIGVSRF